MNFLFDTNIYDLVIKDSLFSYLFIEELIFRTHRLLITHIQIDQINEIKDNNKREVIILFASLSDWLPTSIDIFGFSKIGASCWCGDKEVGDLSIIKGNSSNDGSVYDAILAVTAINQNLVLVTEDFRLLKAARRAKCKVMRYLEFQRCVVG